MPKITPTKLILRYTVHLALTVRSNIWSWRAAVFQYEVGVMRVQHWWSVEHWCWWVNDVATTTAIAAVVIMRLCCTRVYVLDNCLGGVRRTFLYTPSCASISLHGGGDTRVSPQPWREINGQSSGQSTPHYCPPLIHLHSPPARRV